MFQVFWYTLYVIFLSVTVAVCQPLELSCNWPRDRDKKSTRACISVYNYFYRIKINQSFWFVCVFSSFFFHEIKEWKFQDVTTTNCSYNNHWNIAFIGANHQHWVFGYSTRNIETFAIRKYLYIFISSPFHLKSRSFSNSNVFCVCICVSMMLLLLPPLLCVCVWNVQLLGIICVVLVTINYENHGQTSKSELFFYLMTTTFLICTTILLVSCLFSWSTGGIISKTIYVSKRNHIVMFWCKFRFNFSFVVLFYCVQISGIDLSLCCVRFDHSCIDFVPCLLVW